MIGKGVFLQIIGAGFGLLLLIGLPGLIIFYARKAKASTTHKDTK